MSQEPAPQNSNIFKYATIAMAAVLVIGAGAWYVSSNNKKQAAAEAALVTAKAELDAQRAKEQAAAEAAKAELAAQKAKAEMAIESAKSELTAQKQKESSAREAMGKKSAKLYEEYMRKSTAARITAVSIRKGAEELKTMLLKDRELAQLGSFDVRQAISQSAKYFEQLTKYRETLDLRGIDPDLIAYIDKNTALDNAAKKAYEDYAATGVKPDEDLVRIISRREKLVDNDEAKLIAKFKETYGVELAATETIRTAAKSSLDAESKAFAAKLDERKVAQALIGRSFTNLTNPGSKWRLEAAEFVSGTFNAKEGGEGMAAAMIQIEVRNPRTNNTGLLLAIVIYAKPASESALTWPIIVAWTP
jgi:hypothetical protein